MLRLFYPCKSAAKHKKFIEFREMRSIQQKHVAMNNTCSTSRDTAHSHTQTHKGEENNGRSMCHPMQSSRHKPRCTTNDHRKNKKYADEKPENNKWVPEAKIQILVDTHEDTTHAQVICGDSWISAFTQHVLSCACVVASSYRVLSAPYEQVCCLSGGNLLIIENGVGVCVSKAF
jgi:hypothetical protein